VIVETAQSAREADADLKLREKKKSQLNAAARVGELFASMDKDKSGELGIDELMTGYDEIAEVRQALEMLGVERDDVEDCFHLMDSDDSATLSPHEFASNLHKAEVLDVRMQMMLLKLQVSQVHKLMKREFRKLPHREPSKKLHRADASMEMLVCRAGRLQSTYGKLILVWGAGRLQAMAPKRQRPT